MPILWDGARPRRPDRGLPVVVRLGQLDQADADTFNGHKPMQAPAQGRRSSKTQEVAVVEDGCPRAIPDGLTFGTSIKVRGSSGPSFAATSPRSVGGPRLGGLLGGHDDVRMLGRASPSPPV